MQKLTDAQQLVIDDLIKVNESGILTHKVVGVSPEHHAVIIEESRRSLLLPSGTSVPIGGDHFWTEED